MQCAPTLRCCDVDSPEGACNAPLRFAAKVLRARRAHAMRPYAGAYCDFSLLKRSFACAARGSEASHNLRNVSSSTIASSRSPLFSKELLSKKCVLGSFGASFTASLYEFTAGTT